MSFSWSENIPWSKYKRVVVTGQVTLTPEQMIQFKEAAENTFHGDWDRLVPTSGTILIQSMLFKQDDLDIIEEDIIKIAAECPFLNIHVKLSHDFTDEDGYEIYDHHICEMTVSNGSVDVL